MVRYLEFFTAHQLKITVVRDLCGLGHQWGLAKASYWLQIPTSLHTQRAPSTTLEQEISHRVGQYPDGACYTKSQVGPRNADQDYSLLILLNTILAPKNLKAHN